MARSYVYDIRSWEQRDHSGGGILLCPGPRVLHRRFVIFFIALAALFPFWVLYSAAPELGELWTLRQSITENSGALDKTAAAAHVRQLLILTMLFVMALGILAPVSCLWNCVRIERTPRGDLSVFRRGILLPSTREWPVAAFSHIAPCVNEVIRNNRFGRYPVWWFSVRLIPAQRDGTRLEFRLIEQSGPASLYFPQALQQLAAALEHTTGLAATGFDAKFSEHAPGTNRVHVVASTPQVTRQVYNSLEEAPPELRARFEQLKASAGRSGTSSIVSETITIMENGQTRTYHSLDEMPPDVRARYEEAKRAAQLRDDF